MRETIVLGGGCFWCTEAVFRQLRGVADVVPGYAGGDMPEPSYEQVRGGATGHAEVVKIDFDSSVITLRELLAVFFSTHDPTTINRQGADIGTQYRSVIYYVSDAQKMVIENFINELTDDHIFGASIATEIAPLTQFYPADDYHQSYYERNYDSRYCQLVINPKLKKLRDSFTRLLK